MPQNATSAAVSARFLETQSCRRCMYAPVMGCGGGGGGGGRAFSGSQPSGTDRFRYPATFWKCRSEASKMLPVNLRMSWVYSES